jgi:hypothetical protein
MLILLSILPLTSPKNVKTERFFFFVRNNIFLDDTFGGTSNMGLYGAFYIMITAFLKKAINGFFFFCIDNVPFV